MKLAGGAGYAAEQGEEFCKNILNIFFKLAEEKKYGEAADYFA